LDAVNAELGGDDVHSKAFHMRDNVVPAMRAVRAVCDKLERMVPEDLWPLPRYREMLFIR
jgi:glutamine synthetase